MKLSKGFNKVLSLVLAGAMVLTGITVADTKKADAATSVVEIKNAAGDVVKESALYAVFAGQTEFQTSNNGKKQGLGIDVAAFKEYAKGKFGDGLTLTLTGGGNNAGTVTEFDNGHWEYTGGTGDTFDAVKAEDADVSKMLALFNNAADPTLEVQLSVAKDTTKLAENLGPLVENGIKLVKGTKLSIFVGANLGEQTTGGCWAHSRDAWNTVAGWSVDYNATTQCVEFLWNGDEVPAGQQLWANVTINSEPGDKPAFSTPLYQIPVTIVDDAKEATSDIEGTPISGVNYGSLETYTVTVVDPYDPDATPAPTPTKKPDTNTSGSGVSGGATSGSNTSGSNTSGAGTGEPTDLPEDQQFSAFIGMADAEWYQQAGIAKTGGYQVVGFDQANEKLPQTSLTEITSTGVYSLALTGAMKTAEGVSWFAIATDMTSATQAKNGLIVKPVEVIYGTDTFKTFPMSAYYADEGNMRYSFANTYGDEKANPLGCDAFAMEAGEGIYVKFVVAFSEADAAKLVEKYDDADTYDEIQKEVQKAKDELANATSSPEPTAPGGTATQAPKPTAKPTAAPTLKVAGKITMGAKEKVTVKATTNQASVKATSSKTSAVKASASGKNIKLTAGKKAGSANITVTAGTKKATIKVTVKAAPKKIKVAKKTVNVKRGKKATTKVKFTPKKAAAYTIKVTNAKQLKKKKVTVTVTNGKITVKADKKAKKGTLTVKLQTYNKKKTTFKVKVK